MVWTKINPKQDRQAFATHFNYADCLATLTNNVSMIYKGKLSKQDLPGLEKKLNLINLTKKSLEDEYRIVQIDQDYSYASTSWLPIKGYYLLFNMFLTIEYILTGRIDKFNLGHQKCIEEFTNKLTTRKIVFSIPLLNQVFSGNIFSLRETIGANLSMKVQLERRYRMAMRKVSIYKRDYSKRKFNINPRTKTGKTKLSEYTKDFKISIFEFPYYMRIRSNYRDFAFIDNVTSSETKDYFITYYSFIMNLYKALDNLKNDLTRLRS